MKKDDRFTFEISLSVLDHLGRNLYRSFVTVLGEAISNSWDADAKNVWIFVDRKKNNLVIKDDGTGMSGDDFQNKFLKIGYSKRRDGKHKSENGRPFIGRKGIGKLALLSCAKKITVVSRGKGSEYIGGVIDNSGLNRAIKHDLTPDQYPLEMPDTNVYKKYSKRNGKGTIIIFENINDGIKNSAEYLKKIIALYFRFSLLDGSFNIYLDGEKITHEHLKDLWEKTEFLWIINRHKDPFIESIQKNFSEKNAKGFIETSGNIKGFIASVRYPSYLKSITAEEKVGVDLFVNGRLREKDILKHIPTARVAENYLYGQIHFDELDDGTKDRFTSSREGVVADDSKYEQFLDILRKKIIGKIIDDWDKWRIKNREDGDDENKRLSRRDRKSLSLFNIVSKDYDLPRNSKNREKIDGWVGDLSDDARHNFSSYAECFISENLIRKFIKEKNVKLSDEAKTEVTKRKNNEVQHKNKGNLSISIRKTPVDSSYLSMDSLANMVDKKDPIKEACLSRDANEYKPIRDAVAHTALLTDAAKNKLATVYENIKGRIKTLLFDGN
ncbi:MAG: ATP-binding protein [Candidatus Moranbacteria bacterium]|nr:ATP-binding protein [Candidatus Moranbacteria bacterium]